LAAAKAKQKGLLDQLELSQKQKKKKKKQKLVIFSALLNYYYFNHFIFIFLQNFYLVAEEQIFAN
jgi:hypothetical protein